ncbi:MAG: GNAT family N-acetyltransferase [Anaerolineae bacterium]
MSYSIREFNGSDADYAICVELYNKAWPEYYRTEKVYRFSDGARNPKYFHKRIIAEQNGVPVGLCTYMEEYESEDEDDYFTMISIDPAADYLATAESIFGHMITDLRSRNGIKLNTVFLEDRLETKTYLESSGWAFAQRDPRSELDVQTFDFGPYSGLDEKMAAEGIEIANLTALKERFPDWQRLMYELEGPIIRDIPAPFPIKQEPFEDFVKWFDHPNFLPESDFYALEGDKWVGLSNVKKVDGISDYMSVGLTGTLPSHRRRGIATALKVKTIEFAKQYGAKFIRTDNEENNPMYYLNLQLGFEPKPALLNYELKLGNS